MHTCTSSLLGAVLVSLVLMMEYEGDVACLPRMSLPVLTGRGRGCWCGGAGRRAGGGPDPGASGRVSAGEGPRRLGRAGATRQRARGGGAASAGAARLPAGGGGGRSRPPAMATPLGRRGHCRGAAGPLLVRWWGGCWRLLTGGRRGSPLVSRTSQTSAGVTIPSSLQTNSSTWHGFSDCGHRDGGGQPPAARPRSQPC